METSLPSVKRPFTYIDNKNRFLLRKEENFFA